MPDTEYDEIIEVCCHRVKIFWDTYGIKLLASEQIDLTKRLNEAAEERAKECISDGCPQGQLITTWTDNSGKSHDICGWYKIESMA